jgi:type IV pilus assembly protein PilC
MVRAGEEAGKLDQTFAFLADYLDRNYEITQKARNALIYPAFVIATFFVVMGLMMTMVIPRLAGILTETGQAIPMYTRVVLGISSFLSSYIVPILILLVIGAFLLFRYSRTETGSAAVARLQLGVPYIGDIFRKIYLSRIADNLSTMLKSGIQMVRGIEITASVVGNRTYEDILTKITDEVKSGLPVSDAMRKYEEFPGIVVAMVKIGEETGNVGEILDTMARFYRREVNNAIDTLVGLIEPFMIVTLAVGVAFLLASVLIPIYNISSGF